MDLKKIAAKMLSRIIRAVIWCVFKLLALLYVPIYVFRSLQKRKFCPPIEDEILLIPAKTLARKIAQKEVTCEHVLNTYIRRVNAVNPLLNAVVEDRFELALKDAKEVDKFLKITNKSVEDILENKPLLGVPVTVKQSISVHGMCHNAGSKVVDAGPAKKDAKVVELVRKAGAIPFLTSNTPEYCLCWETFNNVTGTTNNPYDHRKTCGGSSGGEAALISSAASVIGIGSDVGGSLRLPAHFCGIFGHKPSRYRVSIDGHKPDCKNRDLWTKNFILGPLTRYACDLPLLLRVLSDDLRKNELKLTETFDMKKIKIYYMENDAGNTLSSRVDLEIIEGMRRVADYFKTHHNNEVKKVNFKKFKLSPSLAYLSMLHIDGVDNVFTDAKISFWLELLKSLIGCSNVTLPAIIYELFYRVVSNITPKSVLAKVTKGIDDLKNELEITLGNDGVLLYPCFTNPALFHRQIYSKAFDCTYMALFNALGLPATSCPIGFNSHGLPMGIQIIAKTDCDNLCLNVAEELEKAYRGWQPPPTNWPKPKDWLQYKFGGRLN